jgi:hypothetical protein
MSKARAKEPSKGGMPRFVPTDEDRALVKLLIANGYARHVVCQYISNRRGSHISESTLKRAFAHELKVGKVELDTIVLTQFMAAIHRGERWAICKYMDQQMWRPESGGWRARPYEVAVSGAKSVDSGGSDLPPLQMIVKFVAPDPSMRPILPR